MYIRCEHCDWSQDDFYSESYNPASYLADWNEYLFGSKRYRLDEVFSDDLEFVRENGTITTREVLSREYEKFADRIRTMKWFTYEDYKKDADAGNAICPNCGSKEHLNID